MRYLVFIAFYVLIGLGIYAATSNQRPETLTTDDIGKAVLLWPAIVSGKVWADYLRANPTPTTPASTEIQRP